MLPLSSFGGMSGLLISYLKTIVLFLSTFGSGVLVLPSLIVVG